VQLTIILAIFLAVLIGENFADLSSQLYPKVPDWTWQRSVTMIVGSTLLIWSLMRLTANIAVAKLTRSQKAGRLSLGLPGRMDLLMQIIIVGIFAVQLSICGWAKVVRLDFQLARLIALDEILLILPFVLMLLLKWHCFYPVNRFVREYIMMGQLSEGLAARPVWTRPQYISFHLRHGLLIILVPLLLILTYRDVVQLIGTYWLSSHPDADKTHLAMEIATIAGAGLIFLFSPLLLRRIWLTRTLPAGPLRDRLKNFCENINLKCRDILLWDTYSAVSNAAVMGLLRPIRYVLLSDALIENTSDEQIEAVFGHEAGHIKHHHIMFLILFIAGFGSTTTLFVELIGHYLANDAKGSTTQSIAAEGLMYGFALALIACWIISFGWVSRRFEWQADIHGALAVAKESNTPRRLSGSGAAIMSAALLRIASLNGIPIEARSWRHSSIANRMAFLHQLAAEDDALNHFSWMLKVTKLIIILSVALGALGWYLLAQYIK